jgi:hypothetical protein
MICHTCVEHVYRSYIAHVSMFVCMHTTSEYTRTHIQQQFLQKRGAALSNAKQDARTAMNSARREADGLGNKTNAASKGRLNKIVSRIPAPGTVTFKSTKNAALTDASLTTTASSATATANNITTEDNAAAKKQSAAAAAAAAGFAFKPPSSTTATGQAATKAVGAASAGASPNIAVGKCAGSAHKRAGISGVGNADGSCKKAKVVAAQYKPHVGKLPPFTFDNR